VGSGAADLQDGSSRFTVGGPHVCHACTMLWAVLADALTGSRLILGVAVAGALVGDRVHLFSILLSVAWATDVFDGRLARKADRPTLFARADMLVDTWVGICVLAGLGLSSRAPLWLVVVGSGLLAIIYLRTKNPAVSQILQGIAYGAALWLIFRTPESTLAIPLGTLALLMVLEYRKFVDKVLPMFFRGVVAFVRREHYEGPGDGPPTDAEE